VSDPGAARGDGRRLAELATLHSIQTAYRDVAGTHVRASPEELLAALRVLGAPVDGPADVAGALRERRLALARRPLEPVVVAWDGRPGPIEVRLPAGSGGSARSGGSAPSGGSRPSARSTVRCRLEIEGGEAREWTWRPRDAPAWAREEEVEGVRFVVAELGLPGRTPLPHGYHALTVELGGEAAESVVISAPRRPRGHGEHPPGGGPERPWGVFLPLYAARSRSSWGIGDLSDLGRLLEWVASLGGSLVATLPLLAQLLGEPFQPAPYSPASRRFWNELFVDVEAVPELRDCPEARELIASPSFRADLRRVRSAPLVRYREVAGLKRAAMEALAATFFAGDGGRTAAFRAWTRSNPGVGDYARFMAACDRHRQPWGRWPARQRDGRLPADGGDEAARRYHLYVQWVASRQMEAVGRRARQAGAGLYFDLPVGVSPDGYDVWRERDAFVVGASAGAPPDTFFTGGQDWGFPPPHPDGVRRGGHRYFAACVRHLLRHADVLRIDHVMGLHRMLLIPPGLGPTEGVYVRYPAEELYAVLAVESARGRAVIVGEDLGTVPGQVRRSMSRHGLMRSHVLQLEVDADGERPLGPVPRRSLAALNTHDMPPFAAFWRGLDVDRRRAQGLIDDAEAVRDREGRARMRRALTGYLRARRRLRGRGTPEERTVLRALLSYLAASDARMVAVNLEDLWLETEPQNVPGTTDQYPNWRRRARYGIAAFSRMPEVVRTLRLVDELRRRGERTMAG
jgi:4-alpha-glucanotransferase